MITLHKIVLFCLLLYRLPVWSQTIRFNEINSSNAPDLIARTVSEKSLQPSSMSLIQQNGYANYAEANINSSTELLVLQTGGYNYLTFSNNFTDKASKVSVSAQGNNNIIDITGSNSISEKLKINIQGDNKTIFIRNY